VWKADEPIRAIRDIVDQIDRGLRGVPPSGSLTVIPRRH